MQPLPSLPAHTLNHLRGRIASGEWSETLPPERVLATELRVSRPTLRLALAQLKKEGWLRVEGRRTCICRPARRRAPVSAWTSVAGRRINFLSPLAIDEMPTSALVVCEELASRLAEQGASLRVLQCVAMQGPRPEKALQKLLHDARADGWILHRAPLPVQRFFQSAKVPCALFGNPHPGISIASVSFEFAAVARHAATTLRRFGHEAGRIAVVVSDTQLAGNSEVERGVGEVLGVGAFNVLRFREDGSNLGSLCDAVLRRRERPTAFIIHRPTAALHCASRVLSVHGLGIPRDLSIVCLENSRYLAAFCPEIARYHHGFAVIARRLFESIAASASGIPRTSRQHSLLPDLIAGSSIAGPR